MRLALSCAAAALLVVGAARAHIDVSPTFVPSGGTAVLSLTAHNDRNEPMTGFEVTVPAGLEIVGGYTVGKWKGRVRGATITWNGGSVASGDDTVFAVELAASAEPGPAELDVQQLYPGDEAATWTVKLTIVPAAEPAGSGSTPWWAIGVFAVLGIALVTLVAAAIAGWRGLRKSLQEE